ncbi:MAG: glycosyltransferase family 4 protein [Chloroflexi bacterium]|nr:glycosyltransferase family 4 protein [Chloroflexota bacterium]
MRIGFNVLFLKQPMTGSGQYTANLLRALARIDRRNSYVLLGSGLEDASVALEWPSHRYRDVRTPFGAFNRQLDKVWFEQVSVPTACREEGIDIVHYPYFAAPLIARARSRVVVTVHDVIPLLLPPYRGSLAVRTYTRLVSTAARRADVVIADSESTKADIVRLLGIPSERIRVVYLAADERFKPVEDSAALEGVRRKYGLRDSFVLYLGGLDARKNVVSLAKAFAVASRELGADIQLAIAGQPMSGSKLFPDIHGAVRELGIERSVVFLGLVAEDDRPLLYSAAKLFAFPSLYEGFGLPPLEAMACGSPVVCSNTSSLPEVVGDAAITCEPTDHLRLAEAMLQVLTDGDLRAELRRRGLARSQSFDWKKTAEETLSVYEAIA